MAYYYDQGHLDHLEASFSHNAVISMQIAGGDVIGPFQGREDIMALYRDAKSTQTDVRRHDITNVFFDVADGVISTTSYLTLFATEHGETKLLTTGIYRDIVEQSEGTWRVVKRHIDLDSGY
jgi:hypothetical protein